MNKVKKGVFLVRKGSYMGREKKGKIRKTWSMPKIGKVIINFCRENGNFFREKLFRNLGPQKFSVPQTRRQVSANDNVYLSKFKCRYLYRIVLYLYIYTALLAVNINQKRFQCERPREKRVHGCKY